MINTNSDTENTYINFYRREYVYSFLKMHGYMKLNEVGFFWATVCKPFGLMLLGRCLVCL